MKFTVSWDYCSCYSLTDLEKVTYTEEMLLVLEFGLFFHVVVFFLN